MTEKLQYAKLYLEKAESKLASALTNLEHAQYDDSVSRSYYCVFHAVSGLLFIKDAEFSSHSQTLGYFNKEFIKTKIFPLHYGKWVYKLFEFRDTGDYVVNTSISEKDARESYQRASEILGAIQNYIHDNYES